MLFAFAALAGCAAEVTQIEGSPQPAETPDTIIRLADHMRSQGDMPMAIALYQRAMATSQDADEIATLGRNLSVSGAHEQAAQAYRRALELRPNDPALQAELGSELLSSGDVPGSIEMLAKAVQSDRVTDPRYFNRLGAALDLAGAHEQARSIYQKGLVIAPNDLNLAANLALSLAISGRFDQAATVIQNVGQRPGAGRQHYRNLVLILAMAGRNQEALAFAQTRLQRDEIEKLLSEAENLRRIPDSAGRARALGTASS